LNSRPAVLDDLVVVVHPSGLQGLDLATGRERWLLDLRATGDLVEQPGASVVIQDGRIYLGTYDGTMLCVDPGDPDDPDDDGPRLVWKSEPEGQPVWDPAVAGDSLVSSIWLLGVACWDEETGERRWRADLPGASAFRPAIAGDAVHVISTGDDGNPGRVQALSARDGSVRWSTSVPRALGSRVIRGPVLTGDRVLAGTSLNLLGLDRETGEIRWSHPVRNFGSTRLAVDDEDRLFAGNDGLLVLDSRDGRVLLDLEVARLPEVHDLRDEAARQNYLALAGAIGRVSPPTFAPGDDGLLYLQTQKGAALALRIEFPE